MLTSFSTLVLSFILLVVFYVLLRRTQSYWIKPLTQLLFPVGYRLYTTRLGYAFHLRSLSKEKSRPSPHSVTQPTVLSGGVRIVPVAILEDNYSYLVVDTVNKEAVVIDPADPGPVKNYVMQMGVSLKAVLTTHKHWDHAGGNFLLKKQYPSLQVYGGCNEHVPGQTHPVKDNDTIQIGKLMFDVLLTPGHTTGHVVYMLRGDPYCLFTGDLIFIAGNGKMFEGSPQTMLESMQRIKQLPPKSLIFPGHEYAFADVKFAATLLPTYTPIQLKWKWVKQQRARKLSTVPSILAEEMKYNPFLLTDTEILKNALGLPQNTDQSQVLAKLRKTKDEFRTDT